MTGGHHCCVGGDVLVGSNLRRVLAARFCPVLPPSPAALDSGLRRAQASATLSGGAEKKQVTSGSWVIVGY